MARIPQSGKKVFRVSDVITDHGTSLGILFQRANALLRVEQLLSGFLDPEFAAHFQVAAIREDRLVLISPSANWATRLRMQSPRLIQHLEQAGYPEIKHIDIRVAPLSEQHTEYRKKRSLSAAARQALEAMARIEADTEE